METKMCPKCNEEKLYSEFHKNKLSKDGYGYICKKCDAIKCKKYRKNNIDKISIKQKKKL